MASTLGAPELPPCPHCGELHPEDALTCPRGGEGLPLRGRLLDGKFKFLNLLGEGGMGAVWRAENVLVHKTVALKLMHGEFARNEKTLARFRNEATAAGRIGNAHICDILDLGRSSIGPYIVMELLRGQSLADLLERGRVETGLAVLIARQALEGLEAAHRVGIVHRDLKPENVFLHEPAPGRLLVKLMDFGISKFSEGGESKTGVGVLMGTPEYMSPEQSEGAAGVDERTDVWAMGVILYRALTGQEAFLGQTLAATLMAVASKDPPPIASLNPDVPPQLADVVMRCLAKNKDDRFRSARELSDALAPFDEVGGAVEMPPTPADAAEIDPGSSVKTAMGAAHTMLAPDEDQDETAETRADTAAPDQAAAPARDPGDSWSLGGVEAPVRPSSTIKQESSPVWIGIVLVVLAGVAAGVMFFPRGGDQVAVASETGGEAEDASASAGSRGTKGGDSKTGKASEDGTASAPDVGVAADAAGTKMDVADDSTTGPGGDVKTSAEGAGETSGATKTDGGSAGDGDDAGGKLSSDDGGSAGGDDGGKTDTGGGKPPVERIDSSKLHKVGGLYAPKDSGGRVSLAGAKRRCSNLRNQKFAGLRGWRLASGAEIALFKGKVSPTLYWTRGGKAYNSMRGTEVATNAKTAKARALCVSRRK